MIQTTQQMKRVCNGRTKNSTHVEEAGEIPLLSGTDTLEHIWPLAWWTATGLPLSFSSSPILSLLLTNINILSHFLLKDAWDFQKIQSWTAEGGKTEFFSFSFRNYCNSRGELSIELGSILSAARAVGTSQHVVDLSTSGQHVDQEDWRMKNY